MTTKLCLSCLKANGLDETFCELVKEKVSSARPDLRFEIETTSCLRVCPENRITISISPIESETSQLSMSRSPSLEDVVRLILNFAREKTKVE